MVCHSTWIPRLLCEHATQLAAAFTEVQRCFERGRSRFQTRAIVVQPQAASTHLASRFIGKALAFRHRSHNTRRRETLRPVRGYHVLKLGTPLPIFPDHLTHQLSLRPICEQNALRGLAPNSGKDFTKPRVPGRATSQFLAKSALCEWLVSTSLAINLHQSLAILQKAPNRTVAVTSSKLGAQIGDPLRHLLLREA